MCGIIAVLLPPGARLAPSADDVTGPLHDAVAALASDLPLVVACGRAADRLEAGDARLRGTDGVRALVHDRRLLADVEGLAAQLGERTGDIEAGPAPARGGQAGDGGGARRA